MVKMWKRWGVVEALASLILGVLLLTFPQEMREIVYCLLGAAIVLFGVVRLISYFGKQVVFGVGNDFTVGVCMMVGGICALVWRNELSAFLSVLLGVVVIVRGVSDWQCAIDLWRMNGKTWWVSLLLGIVDIAFGVVLLCLYQQAVIFRLTGVAFVISALGQLLSVLYFSNVLKEAEKDGASQQLADLSDD